MRILIVGGGLAAQRCARNPARPRHDGPVTMLCAEPHAPYDRPPLSKGVLAGAAHLAFRPRAWYAEHGIELRLGARRSGSTPSRVPSRPAASAALRPAADRHRRAPAHDSRARRPRRTCTSSARSTTRSPSRGALAPRRAARDRRRRPDRPGGRVRRASPRGADATLIDAARDAVRRARGPGARAVARRAPARRGRRLRLGARLDAVDGGERVEALVLAGGERDRLRPVLVGVGVGPPGDRVAAGATSTPRLPGRRLAAGDVDRRRSLGGGGAPGAGRRPRDARPPARAERPRSSGATSTACASSASASRTAPTGRARRRPRRPRLHRHLPPRRAAGRRRRAQGVPARCPPPAGGSAAIDQRRPHDPHRPDRHRRVRRATATASRSRPRCSRSRTSPS